MINFLLGVGTMILVIGVFNTIRGFIVRRAIKTTKKKLNSSIGNRFSKNGKEVFQWKKFGRMFDLGDGVEWIKSIKEIIDLRKLIIYAVIVGALFGYGYWKGKGDTPIQVNLAYDREFHLDLNGEYLHKPRNSNDVFIKDDKTGKVLKHIKAKDFPMLKEKLKPVAFQMKPIFVVGGGLGGDGTALEVGGGVSFLRYWKMTLDAFLTQKAIYLGTSYRFTENSGGGLGVGKGFQGDNRVILYYRFLF